VLNRRTPRRGIKAARRFDHLVSAPWVYLMTRRSFTTVKQLREFGVYELLSVDNDRRRN
jgi:hypothetical protein